MTTPTDLHRALAEVMLRAYVEALGWSLTKDRAIEAIAQALAEKMSASTMRTAITPDGKWVETPILIFNPPPQESP